MIKILFICHGNICRSVAAEMVLRQLVTNRTNRPEMKIESAATTREEIGNDIYPPMRRALQKAGYVCHSHAARQITRSDYEQWDYIIGMDRENLYDLRRICGADHQNKISLLLDWAGKQGQEIDDPWYTRDFDGALCQIEEGCKGLLNEIVKQQGM